MPWEKCQLAKIRQQKWVLWLLVFLYLTWRQLAWLLKTFDISLEERWNNEIVAWQFTRKKDTTEKSQRQINTRRRLLVLLHPTVPVDRLDHICSLFQLELQFFFWNLFDIYNIKNTLRITSLTIDVSSSPKSNNENLPYLDETTQLPEQEQRPLFFRQDRFEVCPPEIASRIWLLCFDKIPAKLWSYPPSAFETVFHTLEKSQEVNVSFLWLISWDGLDIISQSRLQSFQTGRQCPWESWIHGGLLVPWAWT